MSMDQRKLKLKIMMLEDVHEELKSKGSPQALVSFIELQIMNLKDDLRK